MAIGDGIIQGRSIRVYIDGVQVAYSDSCSLSLSPQYKEYSNDDLPKLFKKLDFIDWNISGGGLTVWSPTIMVQEGPHGGSGSRKTTISLIDNMMSDKEVTVKFGLRSASTPNTSGETIQDNDVYYEGKAKIGDLSIEAGANAQDSTYSFTFNRNADLEKVEAVSGSVTLPSTLTASSSTQTISWSSEIDNVRAVRVEIIDTDGVIKSSHYSIVQSTGVSGNLALESGTFTASDTVRCVFLNDGEMKEMDATVS